MNNIKQELFEGFERAFNRIIDKQNNHYWSLTHSAPGPINSKSHLIKEFIDFVSSSGFSKEEILNEIGKSYLLDFLFEYRNCARFDVKELQDEFLPLIAKDKNKYEKILTYCLSQYTVLSNVEENKREELEKKLESIFISVLDAGIKSGVLSQLNEKVFITNNVKYREILKSNEAIELNDGFSEKKLLEMASNFLSPYARDADRQLLTKYIISHIDEFKDRFKTVKSFDDWAKINLRRKSKTNELLGPITAIELFDSIIDLTGQTSNKTQKELVNNWLADNNFFLELLNNISYKNNLVSQFKDEVISHVNKLSAEDKRKIINEADTYDLDINKNRSILANLVVVAEKQRYNLDDCFNLFNSVMSFNGYINKAEHPETTVLMSSLYHYCARHLEEVYYNNPQISEDEFQDRLNAFLMKDIDLYPDFMTTRMKDYNIMSSIRKNLDLLHMKNPKNNKLNEIEEQLKSNLDNYFTVFHNSRRSSGSSGSYSYSNGLKIYYNCAVINNDTKSFKRVGILDKTFDKIYTINVTGKKERKGLMCDYPVLFELITIDQGIDNLQYLINDENIDTLENIKYNKKNFVQYFGKTPIIEDILKQLSNNTELFKKFVLEDKKLVKSLLNEDDNDDIKKIITYGMMSEKMNKEQIEESKAIKRKI